MGIRDYNDNKSYKNESCVSNPEYMTILNKMALITSKPLNKRLKMMQYTIQRMVGKPKMSPELVDAFFCSVLKNIKDKKLVNLINMKNNQSPIL